MKNDGYKAVAPAARSRAELRASTGLSSRIRRFAREEDGNLTIMSVFMFVGIIGMCGVGVDLMMNEMKRTQLQHTLDRAVLAAADLDQALDPTSVVEDYFETSGLGDTLTNVVPDIGLNYRTVSATAENRTSPLFLGVMGVEEMVAPAQGTAEERVPNVEVSLVLDISGSMGSTSANGESKIQNLRDAAKDFVDTVIQPDGGGLTTINIVPYNETVNLGSTLAPYYNLTDQHDYSNCAVFDDEDFLTLGIPRGFDDPETAVDETEELERLAHFDRWTENWSSTGIYYSACPTNDYGKIVVHGHDRTTLKTYIDTLGAGGNTAIDLGMKWGTALLDPSANSLVEDMADAGHITDAASTRPAAYNDREAMKIVVLMTDGQNTTQYDLKDENKWGMSPVWIDDRGTSSESDDRFSVRVRDNSGSDNDVYYWTRYRSSNWDYRYRNYPDGGGDARQMTYPELYERFSSRTVERLFMEKPYQNGWLSWSQFLQWNNGHYSRVDADSADARLSDICDEARQAGVTVYAIGFEAPQRGLDAMQDCASSVSHFFDVDGLEIGNTFDAIARTINQLRLTQ